MVGLTENVGACSRIVRQAQHLWLVRDILHQAQGDYYGFCLAPSIRKLIRLIRLIRGEKKTYPAAYCPPGRCFSLGYIRGRCPRLLIVVPSRHQSAYGVLPW